MRGASFFAFRRILAVLSKDQIGVQKEIDQIIPKIKTKKCVGLSGLELISLSPAFFPIFAVLLDFTAEVVLCTLKRLKLCLKINNQNRLTGEIKTNLFLLNLVYFNETSYILGLDKLMSPSINIKNF